jgi:hypothetical protein
VKPILKVSPVLWKWSKSPGVRYIMQKYGIGSWAGCDRVFTFKIPDIFHLKSVSCDVGPVVKVFADVLQPFIGKRGNINIVF